MVVIDSVSHIVSYNEISESEKEDLLTFFKEHGECYIIDMGDSRFCTCKQLISGKDFQDIQVAYGPDMFLEGSNCIVQYGYAIAVDENTKYKAVLRDEPCTYIHPYEYAGGADTWFIDQYDCIFLNDCNEFSVEIIQAIMPLWKGTRLVLVGHNWEDMIPLLPDLPDKECFYEEVLTCARQDELVEGMNALYLTFGLPHEETMERYEKGLMTYDEVMSFLFMFADYRELGELNPDKDFFVMDGYYGNLGLFAMFEKAVCCARYAKSRGFIPVIRILKAQKSIYSDGPGDDIWSKFYHQPEGYSIEEVLHSKHVCFSPGFYNGSIQSSLMNTMSKNVTLGWPKGVYNDRVKAYMEERTKRFLPYPERTLGVLARGTDYVNTQLHNHSIHANKEMICEKIDELLEERDDLEYIYLATEDAGYCEYFKARYGEKIFFTDQKRFVTMQGEMLADHHRKDPEKSDGFTMGVEYALSIDLLSKCNSLLASGGCAGVWQAIKENQGQYNSVFVFDLGKNV